MKKCSKCQELKDESEFSKDKTTKDHLSCWCKECVKQYKQKYYQKNAEKVKEKSRRYRENNLETVRAKQKQYYHENLDLFKEYRKENADKIKQARIRDSEKMKQYRIDHADEIKQYRKDNLDRERARENKRYHADNSFRFVKLQRSRLYHALKNGRKSVSVSRDLGCSIEEGRRYIESQFLPGMNWDNIHVDHIIPFKLLKLEDEYGNEYIPYDYERVVCHYLNLRPMWAKDNMTRKYDDITEHLELIRLIFEHIS